MDLWGKKMNQTLPQNSWNVFIFLNDHFLAYQIKLANIFLSLLAVTDPISWSSGGHSIPNQANRLQGQIPSDNKNATKEAKGGWTQTTKIVFSATSSHSEMH